MIISMTVMALLTTAVAILPSYTQAGYLGYAIFMFIRGVVGVAYGGDITAGFTFAIEWTPKKWRGLAGGLSMGGTGTGGLIGTLFTGLFVALFPLNAMVDYAWRYVFLCALIPFVAVVIARLLIGETPEFQSVKSAGKIEKSPIKSLFQKGTRFRFLQTTMMTIGIGIAYGPANAYFSPMLTSAPSVLSVGQALLAYDVFYVAEIITCIFIGGHLSTIVGRRRLMLVWSVILAVLTMPTLYGMVTFGSANYMLGVLPLAFLLGLVIETPFGVAPSYMNERFGTGHRATGQGLSYCLNNFVSGFLLLSVPFIHLAFTQMETATNYWFTCGIAGIIGGALAFVAFYIGPETSKLDLAKIETSEEK
jgi:MFS family permease